MQDVGQKWCMRDNGCVCDQRRVSYSNGGVGNGDRGMRNCDGGMRNGQRRMSDRMSQRFFAHEGIETVYWVRRVVDNSFRTVGFHQTVTTFDHVSVADLLLLLDIAGACVLQQPQWRLNKPIIAAN